jgi:hypothetical protein
MNRASSQISHSNSVARYSPYVALSHCWGKLQPLTLTATTKERFYSGVPVRALTRIFQDAVSVC